MSRLITAGNSPIRPARGRLIPFRHKTGPIYHPLRNSVERQQFGGSVVTLSRGIPCGEVGLSDVVDKALRTLGTRALKSLTSGRSSEPQFSGIVRTRAPLLPSKPVHSWCGVPQSLDGRTRPADTFFGRSMYPMHALTASRIGIRRRCRSTQPNAVRPVLRAPKIERSGGSRESLPAGNKIYINNFSHALDGMGTPQQLHA